MPRSSSSDLTDLLPACETQSTIDIVLRDGTPLYFCTGGAELFLGGNYYDSYLLRVGELKETLGQATNRVEVKVSNVDREFGLNVASDLRLMELADVVIRRFYRSLNDPEVFEWKHFFTGKAVNAEVVEQSVSFDVIPDTTAAGTCIAAETLSPVNGWLFPEIPEQAPPGSGDNPGGTIGVCFIGSTRFKLFDGEAQTFEKLYEQKEFYTGQFARSFDKNNRPVPGEIESIFRHFVYEYLEVTFADGVSGVTPKHPFFTESGYQPIGRLKQGDKVLTGDGQLIEILDTRLVKVPEGIWVYNAQIKTFKNYTADDKHVHNRSADPDL